MKIRNIFFKKIVIMLFLFSFSTLIFADEHFGHVLQSTNNGRTWKQLRKFNHLIGSLLIDPRTPTTLYASTGTWTNDGHQQEGHGMFKSIDAGATWQPINNGVPTKRGTLLGIDPNNSQRLYCKDNFDENQSGVHKISSLYRSKDGGATWHNANLNNTGIVSLKIDPLNTDIVYVTTYNHGVFKSTDAGETWANITNVIHKHVSAYGLAVDSINPDNLFIGTVEGVYQSTDGGNSWSPSDDGLKQQLVYSLAIDPKKPSIIYAGTNHGHGLFKSIDSGKKWHYAGLKGLGTITVYISPLKHSDIFARTSKTSDKLYQSKDSSLTWEPLELGFATFDTEALAIDPINRNTLYVGTHMWSHKH